MPFDITVFNGSGGSYEVTVQDGWVNERSPISSGNVTYCHKPGNIMTAGERTRFSIGIGDQVSLVVNVDENGGIDSTGGDPVEIAITNEDTASTHYDPPVAADTGSGGVYYYKLGVLRDADATHPTPWIERFLAGSHVSHFRELPRFKKKAGTYDIFKEFDASAGEYKTKGLTAGEGIDIVDDNNSLEIKLDYGTDPEGFTGDITIRDCDGDPGASPPVPGTLKLRIRVANGMIVGINETTTAKPLSNEKGSNLQSCCWVDDADHSHT